MLIALAEFVICLIALAEFVICLIALAEFINTTFVDLLDCCLCLSTPIDLVDVH